MVCLAVGPVWKTDYLRVGLIILRGIATPKTLVFVTRGAITKIVENLPNYPPNEAGPKRADRM
jgi:hypothetical protein